MLVQSVTRSGRYFHVIVDELDAGVQSQAKPKPKLMSLGGVWLLRGYDLRKRLVTIEGGEGIEAGERLEWL